MQLTYSSRRGINIWAGFVDALAALLIVIMFLLLVFVVGQFYLTDALSGKDKTLADLDRQVAHLANLLALEKAAGAGLREQIGELTAQLSSREKDIASLYAEVASKDESIALLHADVASLAELREQLEREVAEFVGKLRESEASVRAEKEISARSLAQIELLNRQVRALRNQLVAVSSALGLESSADDESMENLAARINVALAERTQELARYRSEFFGRLREVLGENPDIRIEGDRFVLQSGLLFDSGSAELGERGKRQVIKLSRILNDVAANIPDDIVWIVRVDGHTDRIPIDTQRYPSNWELSTARALAIVRFMISQDVPAKRLAATGFGEFHPLDTGDTAEAYARNRRIEIKLTAR